MDGFAASVVIAALAIIALGAVFGLASLLTAASRYSPQSAASRACETANRFRAMLLCWENQHRPHSWW